MDVCDKAGKKRFDVILMDVQMPECDGLTATRAIRAGDGPCRDAPIIAVTAHAMAEDRKRCLAAGMNVYLTKPLGSQTLLATLTKVSSELSIGDCSGIADTSDSAEMTR